MIQAFVAGVVAEAEVLVCGWVGELSWGGVRERVELVVKRAAVFSREDSRESLVAVAVVLAWGKALLDLVGSEGVVAQQRGWVEGVVVVLESLVGRGGERNRDALRLIYSYYPGFDQGAQEVSDG